MKILLLAPFPYGTTSGQGGATVCFKALKALSANHMVHVLCFSTGTNDDASAVKDMLSYAKKVDTVALNVSKWKVLKAKLRSVFTLTPEHAIYFESLDFERRLKKTLTDTAPDVVMTQFPQMAQYLSYCKNVATLHDVQDAFSVSWYRRTLHKTKGLSYWYAFKQWHNWVQYESKYYPLARQSWTLSEQDKYGLTAYMPQLNVVNVGLPMIEASTAVRTSHTGKVGFIASFGHPPNLEALQFLIRHIAPIVQSKLAHIEFIVAGRNPPQNLVQSAPSNVKFIGYVDSLADFYNSCDVIVAPLLSGGGVKIKVVEALGFGKALVTTPIGAEGIPMEHNTHALIEMEPNRFAHAICELISSDDMRNQMALAGWEMANRTFAVQAWNDRINNHLAHLPRPVNEGCTA